MAKMKKIAAAMLAVCLMIPCFSFVANAASGTLQFTDPTAKVGENVTIEAKMRTGGEPIGDGNVTVTYDPAVLEFISGVNAAGGDGTVQLTAAGDGTGSELAYSMQFKVLAEGEATLSVSEYTAYLYSNAALDLTLGSSKVTAQPGEPGVQTPNTQAPAAGNATDVKVDVSGTEYTIAEDFSEALIPAGFTKTTLSYQGTDCQVLVQDVSEMYLVYLQAGDGTKEFFLYNKESGTFSPFEQIDVSQDTYIALLQEESNIKLPDAYEKTTINLNENGAQYPAWQNTQNQEYYVVYALSSAGTKGLYQYDTVDKTYQRFTAPDVETEKKATGIFEKLLAFVKNNMAKVLLGAWCVFLLMLIAIIVTAVKLHHRNMELDDLYEDYDGKAGTIENTASEVGKTEKKQKKALAAEPIVSVLEDDFEEDSEESDGFTELGEDDFEDEDFEEEDFEEEAYEDVPDETASDIDDIEDDFDEDFEEDDFEEETRTPAPPKLKEKKIISHTDDDSDFQVDFIDLDD